MLLRSSFGNRAAGKPGSDIVVEGIVLGQKAPRTRYPKVLKKVGEAPEQYGGWDDDEGGDEEDEP